MAFADFMRRILIASLCLLSLVSCKTVIINKCAVDRTVECAESEMKPVIPQFVKEVTFLPLETNDYALLGSVDKIVFCNDKIYVADYSTRKIVVYGMNGTLSFVLDRQGRGPGEYLEIQSFSVSSGDLYILDNFSRKLFVYDSLTGEYKTSTDMPVVAWDVEALSDGGFIFAYVTAGGKLSKKQPPYRLFVTDSELNITNQIFPYGKNEESDVLGYEHYFSACGGKILFCTYGNDVYFVLNRENGDVLETVGVDFENQAPMEDKNDVSLISSYTHFSSVPVICGDYISCDITTKDGGGNHCIWGPDTGGFVSNPEDGGRNCMLQPVASYGDSFVSVLWDREMYDSIVSTGFQSAGEEVESALDNGAVVLVFYHMI